MKNLIVGENKIIRNLNHWNSCNKYVLESTIFSKILSWDPDEWCVQLWIVGVVKYVWQVKPHHHISKVYLLRTNLVPQIQNWTTTVIRICKFVHLHLIPYTYIYMIIDQEIDRLRIFKYMIFYLLLLESQPNKTFRL